MREGRKTPNINIRQPSRHSSRGQSIKLRPILQLNQERNKSKSYKPDPIAIIKKDFLELQNLTEEEQTKIRKQAQKTASKKLRSTQAKIQSDIISMLQGECSKLGVQIEKQKAQNRHLRFQVAQLRKNVDFLSQKIENIYKDNEVLVKDKDYQLMEKGQLKEQVQKLRINYQQLYEEKENNYRIYLTQIKQLKEKLLEFTNSSNSFEKKFEKVLVQKRELEAQLKEKGKQYDYLREVFQVDRREWDEKKMQMQGHAKQNIEKKGQKIGKLQGQIQLLTQKLKQQETIRKKIVDKNQQLQRQLTKKGQISHDLQDQISLLKKRVNDLSILKSSNNTILNKKLQQLSEQNSKLKTNLEILKKKGVIPEQESSKPYLFGLGETD